MGINIDVKRFSIARYSLSWVVWVEEPRTGAGWWYHLNDDFEVTHSAPPYRFSSKEEAEMAIAKYWLLRSAKDMST